MSWDLKTLDEYAKVSSGDSAPQGEENFGVTGTPFVRAGSLVKLINGTPEHELEQIPLEIASGRRMKVYPQGTVLFAKSGMSCTKGFVYQLEQPAHVVSHLAAIECMDGLDPRYLLRWYEANTPARLIENEAYPSIKISKIRNEKIPLPPLAEQKRIAGILDAADALRTKRRESLAELDTLLQSVFIDMFGDPAANPNRWKRTCIGDIGDVQGGLQVTTKRKDLPLEMPYLRVANVHRGRLELDEIKMIRLAPNEKTRTSLKKNDLLIVEGHGNKNEIGRCARWNGAIEGCVHQNHLIRIRCDESLATAKYVEHYLNSESGRRELIGTSRTTSGLNTTSVSKVRATAVHLPPLELQYRFADVVKLIEDHRINHSSHLTQLDSLFYSLQNHAFSGEL